MRKICFLMIIISTFYCTQSAPKKIVVDLERKSGFGPFGRSQKLCFENPHEINVIDKSKLPANLNNLSIRFYHLQPAQYNFQMYLRFHEKIDTVELKQSISRYGADISKLSKAEVNESVLIGLGKKDNESIIVYVDTNNDDDLTDENPIIYKMYKTPKEELEAENKFEPITVNYEYFDGLNIVKDQVSLLINPYKGNLGISGSAAEQQFLAASVYEHRIGQIRVNDKSFEIAVSNRNTSAIYNEKTAQILFSDEPDSKVKLTDDMINNEVGDIININRRDYKIEFINIRGKQIVLGDLGENDDPIGLKIGYRAPLITGHDIDGNYFNLENLRGKYVLLDFWGTWCGPCIAEIPNLKYVYEKFSEESFEIVSVAFDSDISNVKTFISEQKMPWFHLFQDRKDQSKTCPTVKYKVDSFPSTYLICPEGRIIAKKLRGENLEKELSKYLNISS